MLAAAKNAASQRLDGPKILGILTYSARKWDQKM